MGRSVNTKALKSLINQAKNANPFTDTKTVIDSLKKAKKLIDDAARKPRVRSSGGMLRSTRRGVTETGGYSGSFKDIADAEKQLKKAGFQKKVNDTVGKAATIIEMGKFVNDSTKSLFGDTLIGLAGRGIKALGRLFKRRKQQPTDTEKHLYPQSDTAEMEKQYDNTIAGIGTQYGIHGNSLMPSL